MDSESDKTIICSSWEECEPHIVSQKNVTVKSFASLEEAEFSVNFNKVIKVYTDGSCLKNGRQGAVAGIGVYFGRGDPRNISLPYLNKPTNNRAEMTAILEAYKALGEEISRGERVKIYTDSNYTINCFTKWAGSWEKNWSTGMSSVLLRSREVKFMTAWLQKPERLLQQPFLSLSPQHNEAGRMIIITLFKQTDTQILLTSIDEQNVSWKECCHRRALRRLASMRAAIDSVKDRL